MAIAFKKGIEIVIGATDKTKAAFASVNKGTTTLMSKMVRLRTLAISAFGAYTIANGLGRVVTAALEFERGIAEVHTMLYGEAQQFLERFRTQVRDISVEFGQATSATSRGLYDILSAGVAASGAMDVLRASMIAATGGLTDVQTAVDGVTTVMNAYALEAADATHITDLMFAIVKQGKIRFPELAAEIGKLAPIANSAGVSLEDMSAMIAAVVRVEEPARALTALRAAMMSSARSGYVLKDAVQQLSGAGLPEILAAGFTRKSAVGISIMTGNIENLNQQFRNMANVAGEATDATEKVMAGPAFSWQQFKAIVNDAMIAMGEEFMPVIIEVTEHLKNNIKAIREGAKAVGEFVVGIINLVREYWEWIKWTTLATVALKVFVAGFDGIKNTIIAFKTITVAIKGWALASNVAAASQARLTATTFFANQNLRRNLTAIIGVKTGTAGWAAATKVSILAQTGATKAAWGLNAALLANPITIIVAAVVAFGLAWRSATKDMEHAQRVMDELKEFGEKEFKVQEEFKGAETSSEKLAALKKQEQLFLDEKLKPMETYYWTLRKTEQENYDDRQNTLDRHLKNVRDQIKQTENDINLEQGSQKATAAQQQKAMLLSKDLLNERTVLEIKQQYREDALKRELELMEFSYEKRIDGALYNAANLKLLESNLQMELAAIREKHAKKEADKRKKEQKKMVEQRKSMEVSLVKELHELWVKGTSRGLEEQLLLLELKRQEEMAKARQLGVDLALIEAKYAMLREELGRNQLPDSTGINVKESFMGIRAPGSANALNTLHNDNKIMHSLENKQLNISKRAEEHLETIADNIVFDSENIGIFNP